MIRKIKDVWEVFMDYMFPKDLMDPMEALKRDAEELKRVTQKLPDRKQKES